MGCNSREGNVEKGYTFLCYQDTYTAGPIPNRHSIARRRTTNHPVFSLNLRSTLSNPCLRPEIHSHIIIVIILEESLLKSNNTL